MTQHPPVRYAVRHRPDYSRFEIYEIETMQTAKQFKHKKTEEDRARAREEAHTLCDTWNAP